MLCSSNICIEDTKHYVLSCYLHNIGRLGLLSCVNVMFHSNFPASLPRGIIHSVFEKGAFKMAMEGCNLFPIVNALTYTP